jgi:hypothetical protein
VLGAAGLELLGDRAADLGEQRLDGPQVLDHAADAVQPAMDGLIADADGLGGLDQAVAPPSRRSFSAASITGLTPPLVLRSPFDSSLILPTLLRFPGRRPSRRFGRADPQNHLPIR